MNHDELISLVERACYPIDDPGSWAVAEDIVNGGKTLGDTGLVLILAEQVGVDEAQEYVQKWAYGQPRPSLFVMHDGSSTT